VAVDEIVSFNKERWEALCQAGIEYARPWLDLTPENARQRVDPESQLRSVEGKQVLCLAASGGQQSAAFAMLGAAVTVFDLSEGQLANDRLAAEHYRVDVETIQGDMQDLSRFPDSRFDIVWLAHSINFIPRVAGLIRQIGRICRPQAMVRITYTNPFVHGAMDRFQGEGYLLSQPYLDGAEVDLVDPYWRFVGADGAVHAVRGPREFRHRLSTVINSLVSSGFVVRGLWEELGTDPSARPGSWEHFKCIAPPYVTVWARRASEGEEA
jgi:SAM-dependent methyltransferase